MDRETTLQEMTAAIAEMVETDAVAVLALPATVGAVVVVAPRAATMK